MGNSVKYIVSEPEVTIKKKIGLDSIPCPVCHLKDKQHQLLSLHGSVEQGRWKPCGLKKSRLLHSSLPRNKLMLGNTIVSRLCDLW